MLFVYLTLLPFVPSSVYATPVHLTFLTDSIKGPVRVALDTQGNLYVSDTLRNSLLIYNRNGRYLKSLNISRPIGVAIDPAGRIYLGSEGWQRVDVYNPDLSFSHSLRTGQGETAKITRPNSIAIGAAGWIYVVDSINDTVKVFDPTGTLAFSFGSTGNTDGFFNKPTAVAINDAVGEVYVTDLQVTQKNGGLINGARIQVFDKSGAFKRSFGQYGINVGQIATPVDIAVDKAGTLYVVDSFQRVVHILDPAAGAPLGGIYDLNKPFETPQGVAIGKNNLVYITSYAGKSLEVYALDGYTTMATIPAAVTFEGRQLGPTPAPQPITIANSGTGILKWTAAADKPWIILAPSAEGSTGPASSSQLPLGVNHANLSAGTHTGTVVVASDFGQTDNIAVTLTVLAAPTVSFSSERLTFRAKKGTSPPSQPVTVTLKNAPSLPWTIKSDSSWLSVTPSAGTTTASASVLVASSALAAGSYSGIATISAPGAVGSKVDIGLTITASKINVTTNSKKAAFTLTGLSTYKGKGLSWTKENAPAGDYAITYNTIAGYRRPPSQARTLVEDGELAFHADYLPWKEITAKKNIITASGPGPGNTALINTYRSDGTAARLHFTAFRKLAYGANITSADIDGDGVAEIIVGAGPGPDNPALVRIFKADGTLLLEFTPFDSLYGVNVAAADLNGDGKAELIVAPGPGPDNPATVRVFAYNSDTREMVPTGVEFTAFDYSYGANITVADTEGDRLPELITAPGPGIQNPAAVKIWKLDTTRPMGAWTAEEAGNIALSGNYGVNIAAGDTDGDGKDEIIVGTGPDPTALPEIKILKADGTELKRFTAFSHYQYGVNVSAADLDGDGIAEVVAGAGPDPARAAGTYKEGRVLRTEHSVKIFSASGECEYTIKPYSKTTYGVKVAIGDLGL